MSARSVCVWCVLVASCSSPPGGAQRVSSATTPCQYAVNGDGYLDLDGDGINDSQVGPSPGNCLSPLTGGQCLIVNTCLFNNARLQVRLSDDAAPLYDANYTLNHNVAPNDAPRVGTLGDFTKDGIQEVFLLYGHGAAPQQPAVVVADLAPNGQGILGDVTGPPPGVYWWKQGYDYHHPESLNWVPYLYINLLLPRDNTGHAYPFLVPGYGDNFEDVKWTYGCLFRYDPAGLVTYPSPPPNPDNSPVKCPSRSFVAVDIQPPSYTFPKVEDQDRYAPQTWFRESGGYVQDRDGDGWDDIHLTYHFREYTISGRTGIPNATVFTQDTFFDPASGWTYDPVTAPTPSPSPSPAGFHSGRTYGTHVAVKFTDSQNHSVDRTVIVAAAQVGTADPSRPNLYDVNCNVSRWVGVLEAPVGTPGQPGKRKLSWSQYYGFASNAFDIQCPVSPVPMCGDPHCAAAARPGDWINGCLHRFSDGTSVVDGAPAVVFNAFAQTPQSLQSTSANSCLWSQCETGDASSCATANAAAAIGHWTFTALSQSNGSSLASIHDTYVWGRTNGLYSDGATIYLAEQMASPTPWQTQPQQSALTASTLSSGALAARDTLPFRGRPVIRKPYQYQPNMSSYGDDNYFAELTQQDVDADGLADVMIQNVDSTPYNCTWVGHSSLTHTLVAKGAVACGCTVPQDCGGNLGCANLACTCQQNTDCSGQWLGPKCVNNTCGCQSDIDCSGNPMGSHCVNNKCSGCSTSADCPATQACDSNTHVCTSCGATALCNGGCCLNGVCVDGGDNGACGVGGGKCHACLAGSSCQPDGSCLRCRPGTCF
jgi:hypothetical protein